MSQAQSSYRQIFKSTSLFGGVQFIVILVGIVRTKFVALLLGVAGVGTIGLLNASLGLITSLTGLGLSYSAIRKISEDYGKGDNKRLAITVISFRRWVIFTGLMGMIITIVLSPWLSEWTFSNKEFIWAFIWLSFTVLINDISSGQKALMQGTRKLQSMAKATVIGSVFGLFASVPLFYFYGTGGIVPSLIISSVVALLLSWYYSAKIPLENLHVPFKESYKNGIAMIRLGVVFSISTQLSFLVTYVLNSYINLMGGLEQVGLYTAGTGLVVSSVGLIFTAMGMDFYPRLAAINQDNDKMKELVNQQSIISILIVVPIILCLLIIMPFLVKLLLSKEFIGIVPFVNSMVAGVLFKALSFPMGYISFAKGDSKMFFWLEGVTNNLLNLILSVTFYSIWGLNGIGIAFIVNYIIYVAVVYLVVKKRYGFAFDKELYGILTICATLITSAYMAVTFLSSYKLYISMAIILLMGILYTFNEINKRLNVAQLLKTRFKKTDDNL